MNWYKEMGFKRNPLEVDPFRNKEEPIGYYDEIENLLYYIESGNTVLIEGPKGSGKTLLLAQAIKNFGGKGRIIYIDGNKVNKRLEISRLLIDNQGFFRRFLKKKPKGMILLLDNAFALPRKSYEQLQYYFDQDYLKSIVFTTDDREKLNFPSSLDDRIGDRIIKTKKLPMEDAVELVLDRLNQDMISKDLLEKVFILSDKDIITFLKNCNKILEYMYENDLEEIDLKTINKVLSEESKEPEKAGEDIDEDDGEADEESPDICAECGENLEKVGEHYRCKNCDFYCPSCGILIEADDIKCPSCGVQFEFDEEE